MINTYKSPKLTLAEDEVFVYGANKDGFSGSGAAGYATFNEFGNVWREYGYQGWPKGAKGKWNVKGVSEGPMLGAEGKSYAIPTVTRAGAKRSIPLETIKESIQTFYSFAKSRLHLKFFVAQENKTGLNGYSPQEMASIYSGEIPENVYFDEGFAKLLENTNYNKKLLQNIQPTEIMAEMAESGASYVKDVMNSREKCKCIIAGSRSITDYSLVCFAVEDSGFPINEIVCGEAKGVDSLGKTYAKNNNIPVKSFPADWNDLSHPDAVIKTNSRGQKYDALAGHRRNKQMADYATHLILIWDGKSSGSANMLKLAKEKNLTIFQKLVN